MKSLSVTPVTKVSELFQISLYFTTQVFVSIYICTRKQKSTLVNICLSLIIAIIVMVFVVTLLEFAQFANNKSIRDRVDPLESHMTLSPFYDDYRAHWLIFIVNKGTDTWIYNLCDMRTI